MRVGLLAALAGAGCVFGTAAAASDKVVAPDWEKRPRGEDMAEHYPGLATTLEIEGRATISCSVDVDGRLTACSVVDESPTDLGFGAAALALADDFLMRPQTVNGVAVPGGTVRIPIAFRLPQTPPEAPPPEPASQATLAAALRLVDALRLVEKSLAETEKNLRYVDPGVPVGVRTAGSQALQAAWRKRGPALRQAYARALASIFVEAEMTAVADFAETAGDMTADDARLQAAQARIVADFLIALREPAQRAYCAERSCPTAADLARVWRPSERDPKVLDNPQWARAPSGFAVQRVAPRLPAAIGLSAAVRMTCRLQKEGELEGCVVDEQLPTGLGYGEAAQDLAKQYKLHPIQLAEVEPNRKVAVRVGFSPSDGAERYAPPRAAKGEALGHARRIAEEVWDTSRLGVEVALLGLQTSKPKSADEELYEALAEAFRAGAAAANGEAIEMFAQALAADRSEEDLARIATFQTSPAGRAFRERGPSIGVALGKAVSYVGVSVVEEARAGFCKAYACEAAPFQSAETSPEPSTRKP